MVYSFRYLLQHFASQQEFGCSYINHIQGSSIMPGFKTVQIIVTQNVFPSILCGDVTQQDFTLFYLKFE